MFDTNELSGYLAPNERVLWQGQGKRRLNATSAGGALFIAMFVSFALILGVIFMATSRGGRSNDDEAVVLIVLPIIFLSIGLGVGIPLLVVSQRSSNARYFVTNAAALIVYPPTGWAGSRVTILPLKNLQQVTLSENRDGTGTLTFGQSLSAGYGRYSNSWLMDSVPAFSNIDQPRDVYQLIRRQMAEA